jgi:hypothetical protein
VPEVLDAVIAKGMAKDPDQRYASTVELARAARDATTVPLARPGPIFPLHPASQPDLPAAGPIHSQDTQLAPLWVKPTPKRPMWRRRRVVVPAVLAVVLLIGGGIFGAVKASQHSAAPNTGPFTGTYRADFGPASRLDGQPVAGATPATETWGLRSVCRPTGCLATASRRSGDTTLVSTMVFDDVGGRWLAVGLASGTCSNAPAEHWQVFTLQTRPDGTLAGEYSSTASNACDNKRAVIFTRTGGVDVNSLPDPTTRAPRVVSPAEALHGRYHQTKTYMSGSKQQEYDYAVRTDCLRNGARCMSYFHGPDLVKGLVFGSGKWTDDETYDSPCPAGGTSHVTVTAAFPLPQPPQDPITLLTGHGYQQESGSACTSSEFDEKYVRTGD